MAPIDKTMKSKKLAAKDGALKTVKNTPAAAKKKKKWISERKVFEGSVKEGQGFAFQRKQKVKHEYNKLLRKERKRNPGSTALYKEEYPEHLKHLYMAEAEKLRKEAWVNRVNRSKLRIKGQEKEVEEKEADADATVGCDTSDAVSGDPEPSASMEEESLPLSNRMKKKMQKKTSYQKTKEEFEGVIEKRKKKKEEYLKNKQQREEAIQKYKQKKLETFQMLSKKTKKGQPNLNLQMEYLLQKIQGNDK